jgi:hypothetical protein
LKICGTGFAGQLFAKPKPTSCHFLSPGERIKVRAGVKTNFFPLLVHPEMILAVEVIFALCARLLPCLAADEFEIAKPLSP